MQLHTESVEKESLKRDKMAEFANIIVDISNEKLDKTFVYRIPQALSSKISVGVRVRIPFGSRKITGYVVELKDETEYDVSRIKEIAGVVTGSVPIESQLIALAGWMRRNYGGTMNQALKTVIPVKEKKKAVEKKTVCLMLQPAEAKSQLAEYIRKHNTARARLLEALIAQRELAWELITGRLNVSGSVISALESAGVVKVLRETRFRNPVGQMEKKEYRLRLNEGQQRVVDAVLHDYDAGGRKPWLLKGVTGSGKTEVYMELIAQIIARGKQAIVLIPEIALTYQTVMRFYNRFFDRVSILNSRLSAGERYDQFLRAKNGEIDIMIGPRSALFTPFPRLGLIIIDEEHENSYKSGNVPRYHARETGVERARMAGAGIVLGSATPSLESYYRAENGEYHMAELTGRVREKPLPACTVVDLREELKEGNRSILSRRLTELMEERLRKGTQTMLFLNRRGMAGFVSCRACGHVIKCPHCDVSLAWHDAVEGRGRLVCHYCGHEEAPAAVCPACGSKYIGAFKAGTQKIEQVVKARFPRARVLRMDFDTTRSKESYEQILSAFANREADILIGTQMIVKGHDFPYVTLVGVLAADLSLNVSDFHAAERTFQLLTQAAGRAGRGEFPGEVVIQTYHPGHYSIVTAAAQDYGAFYEREIEYRRMLLYPPVWNLLVILCASEREEAAGRGAALLAAEINAYADRQADRKLYLIGPADAAVAKVKDIYKKVIYMKARDYQTLVAVKDLAEHYVRDNRDYRDVALQFDFNPADG